MAVVHASAAGDLLVYLLYCGLTSSYKKHGVATTIICINHTKEGPGPLIVFLLIVFLCIVLLVNYVNSVFIKYGPKILWETVVCFPFPISRLTLPLQYQTMQPRTFFRRPCFVLYFRQPP